MAWAAGLFEGEGSICASKSGNRFVNLVLCVTNTDLRVLTKFESAVGCGKIYGPKLRTNPSHKPVYEWHLSSPAMIKALTEALWEWLSDRRRGQITDALGKHDLAIGVRGRGSWRIQPHVTQIKKMLRDGVIQAEIARQFDCGHSLISMIASGKRHKGVV